MKDIYQKRYEASHNLWEAKATSRLESRSILHRELTRLNTEGEISDSVIIKIYNIMHDNYAREEASEAEAQAAYEEVSR